MVICGATPTTPGGRDFKENLTTAIGTWLIGCFFNIFAQGILFMQTVEYFKLYRHDRRSTKIMVVLVFITTLVKCCFNFRNVWYMTVTSHGDFDASGRFNWTSSTNLVTGHVITFICQTFYLQRLRSLKPVMMLIVATTALFCAASLVFSGVMTIPLALSVSKYNGDVSLIDPGLWKLVRPTFLSSTALLVVADSLITGSMLWFLSKSKLDMVELSSESNSIFRVLVRITVISAAPPLIITVLTLGYFSRVNSFSTAFCFLMPSMYAVCMMYNLTHRARSRDPTHQTPSTEQRGQCPDCYCSSTPPRFANMSATVSTTAASMDSTQDAGIIPTASALSTQSRDDFYHRNASDNPRPESCLGAKAHTDVFPQSIAVMSMPSTSRGQPPSTIDIIPSGTLGTGDGLPPATAQDKANTV